ncbi:MAG: GNAT family N-acetyltransferase [Acidimicrobiales bacterium]
MVNNRSFAAHPSQGDQSVERWHETIDAPWFLADGTRIYEDPPGTIAGFCITKIHQTPPVGEIYVIGLDPSVHGRGLGGPMTAAGLDWLATHGQTTAMLYVEADNEPRCGPTSDSALPLSEPTPAATFDRLMTRAR